MAADVYSLGATLFAALTGHAAFERRDGEQVVAQFLRITGEPMPDVRAPGIDDDVAAVVSAAMARDPAERPSALELGVLLQGLQGRRGLVVDDMVGQESQRRDGLAKQAVTPASARRPDVKLPVPLASFVGRAEEIAMLRKLLWESRHVTVTGIGGVGKTTLAIHAARELATEFPDGVWFVGLADLRDGALITDVVADALGVHDQPGRALADVLVEFLTSRHTLMVLDNCEQLINDTAKLADMLLQACPRLHILATSREVLDIDGESVLPLPRWAGEEIGAG